MNTKRNLQSRIRGWFPREPKTGFIAVNETNVKNPQFDINNPGRVTKFSENTIIYIIAWSIFIVNGSLHVPIVNFVVVVSAGITISILSEIAPAHYELKKLTKCGSSSLKLSNICSLIVAIAGACLFIGSLIIIIKEGISNTTAAYTILTFLFALIATSTISKTIYYRNWEKKHNSIIWRSNNIIFSSPKPFYELNFPAKTQQNEGATE